MRTRSRRRPSNRLPEVNLVPMIDVLMVVLVFFLLMSMGPTGGQITGVTLPTSGGGKAGTSTAETKVAPFIIGLNTDKALILEGEPASLEILAPAIETYFKENPEGSIMLKADRTLRYEDISAVLSELRNLLGGRRVSLAVE